jgi:hypothetical protein
VLRVLHGQRVDRVPFTVYECMIPQCAAERQMRNRGLCIVNRSSVFASHQPNVKYTSQTYCEGATRLVRNTWETPAGVLTSVSQPAGFTSWQKEYPFKSADDYRALLFLIQDERYEASYEPYAAAQDALGGDIILRAGIGLEPLQQLISGGWLSPEGFCIEWMDRRDEILKLYDALVAKRREIYPLVAASPASHANYGGNVVPEIIGADTFRRYYLPHYNEAAEVFHKHGKLVGCHFDANCRALAEDIAGSGLDYIEAFTPAPGSDMTLAQACAAWPDKVLWLNFPSALHLADDATVTKATVEMLAEMDSPDGVIMGITEDMPPDRWQNSCRAIMDGLENHSRDNPGLYLASSDPRQ